MPNRNPVRIYTGEDLLKVNESKAEPLIQDVLFKNDYIMITAPPKMGKTILAVQMACSLSAGTPFLGTFEVPKPQRVWYFATEGKDEDMKSRFRRTSGLAGLNIDNLMLICSAGLRFNTTKGQDMLKGLLDKYHDKLPKVIFVDALYRAVKGSLKNDDVVNEFHHSMGILTDKCDASGVVTHHSRRAAKKEDGSYYAQTEEDIYGSTFLLAGIDHQFWLDKWQKNPETKDRMLQCGQYQRSGSIIESTRLHLLQPDPLGFEIVSEHVEEKTKILSLLKEGKLSVVDIISKIGMGRSTVYVVLKELVEENQIAKEGGKVKYYHLI